MASSGTFNIEVRVAYMAELDRCGDTVGAVQAAKDAISTATELDVAYLNVSQINALREAYAFLSKHNEQLPLEEKLSMHTLIACIEETIIYSTTWHEENLLYYFGALNGIIETAYALEKYDAVIDAGEQKLKMTDMMYPDSNESYPYNINLDLLIIKAHLKKADFKNALNALHRFSFEYRCNGISEEDFSSISACLETILVEYRSTPEMQELKILEDMLAAMFYIARMKNSPNDEIALCENALRFYNEEKARYSEAFNDIRNYRTVMRILSIVSEIRQSISYIEENMTKAVMENGYDALLKDAKQENDYLTIIDYNEEKIDRVTRYFWRRLSIASEDFSHTKEMLDACDDIYVVLDKWQKPYPISIVLEDVFYYICEATYIPADKHYTKEDIETALEIFRRAEKILVRYYNADDEYEYGRERAREYRKKEKGYYLKDLTKKIQKCEKILKKVRK